MPGFDRSVRKGFPKPLLPLLRVATRRRQEWEVVAHSHFFGLFILPRLGSGRNSGKKAIQNTLFSGSVPQAFKMQTRHQQDDTSSCSTNTSWRLEGVIRYLKSLVELGRLRTLARAPNCVSLRSSTSFPRPKVPTRTRERCKGVVKKKMWGGGGKHKAEQRGQIL